MDETSARDAFETALATHEPAFGTFFLARLLGFDISYPGDTCVVEFDVHDFMFNPQGTLHGGIVALALDVAAGHLINHEAGRGGVTLEIKVQFIRPALPGRLRCTGSFLKRGRTISNMEARMTDAGGKLLAMATSTWQMPRD